MKEVQLHEFDTGYSADSVEWCPFQGFTELLVCGTYQLIESDDSQQMRTRKGRMYLLKATKDELKVLQTIEPIPAVLDAKWSRRKISGKMLLAVVNAMGQLVLYNLDEDSLSLRKLAEAPLEENHSEDKERLALSVDWSHSQDTAELVVSDSLGALSIFSLSESGLEIKSQWNAHEFEAWTASFDAGLSGLVYSGGDDCKLKLFDLRVSESCPVSVCKHHEAGVTSLLSEKAEPNRLFSGSYDEKIRHWDTRNWKEPLKEVNVGGGIWRIRRDPGVSQLLAIASMYNGFHVLSWDDPDHPVACAFAHDSIAYGIDWCHSESNAKHLIIAACSFYDHKLTIRLLGPDGFCTS